MIVAFESVPIEERAQAAWQMARDGDMLGPDALALAIFGSGSFRIEETPHNFGICGNGHILNDENAYVHPRSGRVKCRHCAREYKRHYRDRTGYWQEPQKCSGCGGPRVKHSRTGMCRKCYEASLIGVRSD